MPGVARRIGLASALVLMAGAAQASVFCEVKKTPDGFVALRAGPQASAKLLRRIPFGDDVQIDDTRAVRKGWQPVIYWGPERKLKIEGWVRARLLSQECG